MPGDVEANALSRARVRIRPLVDADYPFLHAHEAENWRFHGSTPSLAEYADGLQRESLAAFLILERELGSGVERPVGFSNLTDVDWTAGFCSASLVGIATERMSAGEKVALFAGFALTIEHAFAHWPLRKCYLTIPDFVHAKLGSSLDNIFTAEVRLPEAIFTDGSWCDLLIFGVFRDEWERWDETILRYLATGPPAFNGFENFRPTRMWNHE